MTGRESDERTPRYLYEPPTLVAIQPERLPDPPALGIDGQPYVFVDDANPDQLLIHHQGGSCTNPEGGCRPRIVATCAGCGAELVLCWASSTEIQAILARRWRCAACGGV